MERTWKMKGNWDDDDHDGMYGFSLWRIRVEAGGNIQIIISECIV